MTTQTSGYRFAETTAPAGAPLLLTFHGTGGDETQFHDLARQIRPDAHVISPRGDVSEHGANRFFKRRGEGVYDMDDLARRVSAMAGFIMDQKQRTGASHVLALGYSNGANILASVMLSHPALVNAAAWMHPLISWNPAPQPGLKGRKILVTAGQHDPICPATATEALVDYIAAQGAHVTSVWHDGGHAIAQVEIDALAAFLRTA